MSERPPWDPVKAAFFLVSGIFAFLCLCVLITLVWCMFWATSEVLAGKFQCDKDSRITELLMTILASALAYAGGSMRKP